MSNFHTTLFQNSFVRNPWLAKMRLSRQWMKIQDRTEQNRITIMYKTNPELFFSPEFYTFSRIFLVFISGAPIIGNID
jgi:hypothetical protein